MNKKNMNFYSYKLLSLLSLTLLSQPASADLFKCNACPAGYKCDGVSKTICPAGTYSQAGASSCTPCPAGQYQDASGQSSCKSCSAYQWSKPGATKCGRVFVAYTLTGYSNYNAGKVNGTDWKWVNIESFIDNRYCRAGINVGFFAGHGNGFKDIDGNKDYGNFGVNVSTRAVTIEGSGRDFLKANCTTFPCTVTGGIPNYPHHNYTTIDPTNNLITQYFLDGQIIKASNAIKIVDDTNYWNQCFGPK